MKTNFKTIETSIGTVTMWDNVDEPLSEHEIRGNYKVYKFISPEGRVYYGITSQDPEKRWMKGNGYRFNKELWKDINRFGWENFQKQILNEDMSQLDALFAESFYIALSGGVGLEKIYNRASFGTVCEVKDEATRALISEKVKEYYATHENPGLMTRIEYCRTVQAKPVRCVETGVEYPSAQEAHRQTGINRSHISEVCRGERKRAGGVRWEFVVRSS